MKRILLYIVLILAAVGCSKPMETVDQTVGTGELKFEGFSITTLTQEMLAPRPAQATRVDDQIEGMMLHIMSVTITDNATGQVVESYADHTAMPATIVLKAGSYTISARTADINGQIPFNGQVGFDQPQYAATKSIEIVSGQITSVALSCPQSTAGVTVDYSDLFKEVYPCALAGETYRVRIFSSYGGDIVFLKGETRTAHFVVPTQDMIFFYQIIVDRMSKDGSVIETLMGQETAFDPSAMPVNQAHNYNLVVKILNQ